jgi:hypothetical protein
MPEDRTLQSHSCENLKSYIREKQSLRKRRDEERVDKNKAKEDGREEVRVEKAEDGGKRGE